MQHEEQSTDMQFRRSSSVSTRKCPTTFNKDQRSHNYTFCSQTDLQYPNCSCHVDDTNAVQIQNDAGIQAHEITRSQLKEKSLEQQQQQQQVGGNGGGLSHAYQPKVFADIIGHGMIIKALANAAQMKRISTMYLFYGPGGSGKTSTAKIFSMALNCNSTSYSKPCSVCDGCYRSLYTAELCSGKRNSGFEKIRTLLQSTSFTETISGYKVFVIDECHSLSEDSWVELQDIEEKGHGMMVFIMITEDASLVPRGISSRCQKFNFQKLTDSDISLKLAKIVAQEGIEIKNDALTLIARKANGNLREAENLLDQLALLGQRITASMVQQILGLAPHDKLTQLLEATLSGDIIEAMRRTGELIACGIEPRTVVSQLASLVTETLAGNSSSSMQDHSQIRNRQLKKLCNTLRTLVETEKQLFSNSHDHTTWVSAALLQIASEGRSNGIAPDTVLTEFTNPADPTSEKRSSHALDLHTKIKHINMEEVWHDILERIDNKDLGEFLHSQAKLISLTLSRVNAIVHLVIMKPVATDMSEELISNALKDALGCPTSVNITHEPSQLEFVARNSATNEGKQVLQSSHSLQNNASVLSISNTSRRSVDHKGLILKRSVSHNANPMPSGKFAPTRKQTNLQMFASDHYQRREIGHMIHRSRIQPFPDTSSSFMDDDNRNGRNQTRDNCPIGDAIENKHTFLSITSIPHADASIEPYSQDLLFEEAQIDRQQQGRNYFSNSRQNSNNKTYGGLYGSWSCTDIFCPNEKTGKKKPITKK
ncbi:protein STICHEL-like 3 isoform X2 [Dioscorea cayenensis subsp. rotundata]|uniref:Protein STICHEL-like 3 isoform X2 n=1 Tax=Dioscorea cayennensis subsp. rotundata TaxID=55577 RepID=A0AB40BXK7_DIOCR|nr:protein STICHEL-like 3 isoform X2 [Dioscorea cayenensis subsp. rotundata]